VGIVVAVVVVVVAVAVSAVILLKPGEGGATPTTTIMTPTTTTPTTTTTTTIPTMTTTTTPTTTDLGQAENLLASSSEKYDQAIRYWDENDYVNAKIRLIGAITDVEEARKYLEKADIEQGGKQHALCVLDGWSNLLNCVISLSDAFEDYNQGMLRWSYQDWDGVVTKFLDAKEDIDRAQSYFLFAKENFDSVNMEMLPSELKSTVVEIRTYFASYATLLPDFSGMIDAFVPLARSMKSLVEAVNYMQRYDWHASQLAFEDSQSKISEAKNKFDNLRYCQTASFSSYASILFVNSQKIENALSHYIQGCEYAEAGDMSSANSEFETANHILNGISWG
jgi:hypothetical protein